MFQPISSIHLKNIAKIGLSAGLIGTFFGLKEFHTLKAFATPSLLEFRWEENGNYKKLYYWQSSSQKRDRSTYFFVLKPQDRRTAILKLSITVPDYFDAKITPRKLKLCQVQLGGMLTRTKCTKKIPAVFEVNEKQTAIDVFPETPIPAGGSYAVVMKIFNPSETGMFQFNALAQAPGDVPVSSYLGSWNIDIE